MDMDIEETNKQKNGRLLTLAVQDAIRTINTSPSKKRKDMEDIRAPPPTPVDSFNNLDEISKPSVFSRLGEKHERPLRKIHRVEWTENEERKSIRFASKNDQNIKITIANPPRVDDGDLRQSLSTNRCKFWPNCSKGDQCSYFHPSKNDESPTTMACRFGAFCTRPNCAFSHPSPAAAAKMLSSVPCKFGLNCLNPSCAFMHPPLAAESQVLASSTPFGNMSLKTNLSNVSCKFASHCKRPNCAFKHDHASERVFAVDDMETESIPVSNGESIRTDIEILNNASISMVAARVGATVFTKK
jgi:hypothetical protein